MCSFFFSGVCLFVFPALDLDSSGCWGDGLSGSWFRVRSPGLMQRQTFLDSGSTDRDVGLGSC